MHKNAHRQRTGRKAEGFSFCRLFKKWLISAICAASTVLISGCSQIQDAYMRLSSAAVQNQPSIELTLWHGFTGREKEALETLAEDFNTSAGEENRIHLTLKGYENLSVLADAVFQAVREEGEKTDDLPRVPDLFFALDDTANALDQMGWAVHMENFLTEEQRAAFLDSVQAEACPGENGSMVLFPVGIDTDILLVNESLWSQFCQETAGEDGPLYVNQDLATWEGIEKAAKAYGIWAVGENDAPDEPDNPEEDSREEDDEEEQEEEILFLPPDTLPFFCTDSWGRLLVSGYETLGKRMFVSGADSVQFSFERSKVRSFWNFWICGWMDGIFSRESCRDSFSSGNAVACLISTTQARDFSSLKIPQKDSSLGTAEIEVRSVPRFSDGKSVTMQETLGLVMTKGSKEKQAAAQVFLQWLTGEHMADIAVASGRLPALKQAVSDRVLAPAFERQGLSSLERQVLKRAKAQLYTHIQLPLAVFDGSTGVIDAMDRLLLDGGEEVRENYFGLLQEKTEAAQEEDEDTSPENIDEEVRQEMTGDLAYEDWYVSFRDNIVELVFIGQEKAA